MAPLDLSAALIPAQLSPNVAAYTPVSPLASTPWWQQWYVIVPVLGTVAYMLWGMRKKSKPSDASATSTILPTLSGIFGGKRKRK